MEAALALLQKLATAVVSFFIALGALITSHTIAVNPSVSSPATATTTTAAATSSTEVATASPSPTTTASTEPAAQASPETTPTTPPPAQSPALSTEELNALARASLVNILCTTKSGGSFNPISGSGIIIDSRGIILTNAHVAQYFLLRNFGFANNVECVVRTGSPAQPRYTAQLLYLPPSWIAENAQKIKEQDPTGTGENDYAFLRITGTTNPAGTLPSSFPALSMDASYPAPGDQMLLAAYPAGFLGGITIALNLYPASSVATVGQLYNFHDSSLVDLFSLGGTVVSQSGSSGGAAVSSAGKMTGLIVTEVPGETTSDRDLRALTLAHIDRSLKAEGQGGITALLSHDAESFAAQFNANTAPAQTKALEDALTR